MHLLQRLFSYIRYNNYRWLYNVVMNRCLQFYREGVYSDSSCNIDPRNATHEMVVVGYGTDTTYGAYWIVKNRQVEGK